MAFQVTFAFNDGMLRKTTRRYVNTEALLSDVLVDIVAFAPLYDTIAQGGIKQVTISQISAATTLVPDPGSNVDDNASIGVLGGNGFEYDFDLPMPALPITMPGGGINLLDTDLLAFFAIFNAGGPWRINTRNPTDIVSLTKGSVDK